METFSLVLQRTPTQYVSDDDYVDRSVPVLAAIKNDVVDTVDGYFLVRPTRIASFALTVPIDYRQLMAFYSVAESQPYLIHFETIKAEVNLSVYLLVVFVALVLVGINQCCPNR